MTKKIYSNASIHQYITDEITSRFFSNEMHKLSFEEVDANITAQLKRRDENLEFIDILFKKDKDGFCLLFYMVHESADHLFEGVLDKYSDKLNTFIPNEWEFMLWRERNECHNLFEKKYGKNSFDEIANLHANVLLYNEDYFIKYYLQGNLDGFYKIENIQQLNNLCYEDWLPIHTLNFFYSDPDEFKKFMMKNKPNELVNLNRPIRDIDKILFECINIQSLTGYLRLGIPDERGFNILASKIGFDKASETISNFINFQHEYMKSFDDYHKYHVKFDSNKMKSLIKSDIKFINCGKALMAGLQREPDLISYFIISEAISKDDLLVNIQDKELYVRAEHNLLDTNLSKKETVNQPKKSKL